MNNATAEKPRWQRIAGEILRGVEHIFALIGLLFVIYFICFDLSQVISGSMSPTLKGTNINNGDWVLTEKFTYALRQPRRWEVVTHWNSEGTRVVKRIVGLPGEKLQQDLRGPLKIDGEVLEFPEKLGFLNYLPYGYLSDNRTVACGEGYFILGDDSKDSDD